MPRKRSTKRKPSKIIKEIIKEKKVRGCFGTNEYSETSNICPRCCKFDRCGEIRNKIARGLIKFNHG